MPAARTIAMLFFALATGCAGVKEAPPDVTARSGPLAVDPSPVGPKQEAAVSGEAEAAATAPPAPPGLYPMGQSSLPNRWRHGRRINCPHRYGTGAH